MDLLTHLLTGWLLMRALPDRWRGGDGRLRAAGLWLPVTVALGSLLPDLVEGAIGPDRTGDLVRWLESERGWSHGLFGATLAAGALWAATLPTARGDRGAGRWAAGWSPKRAAAVAFAAVGLHLVWDALTPMGLRPLYPFSNSVWVRGDLVLPGDPWVHLILLSGVLLTLWREELGQWASLTLLAAFALWVLAYDGLIGLLSGRNPYELPALLFAGLFAVGVLHVLALRRWRRWPRAPLIAVGLVAGLLASSAAFNAFAIRAAIEDANLQGPMQVHYMHDTDYSRHYGPFGSRQFRYEALAARPVSRLPWERSVVIAGRPEPKDLENRVPPPVMERGTLFVRAEVRLVRTPAAPHFEPEVQVYSPHWPGKNLISQAGLEYDRRVTAWRRWCRFPYAHYRDSPERLTLHDEALTTDFPRGRFPVLTIELDPATAADLRSANATDRSR